MTRLALIGDLHLDERSPRHRHVLEVLDWTIDDAVSTGDNIVFALLGDLFESTPSGSEMAALLTRIKRMAAHGQVLVTLGNHESYDAIAPVDLFHERVTTAWRSPLLTLLPAPGGPAVVLSIPYARRGRAPFDGIEHDGTIQGSMVATANEVGRLVQEAVAHYRGRAPVIVLGHWTIQGMKVKDAEFEIHNATEVVVPRAAFDGVALAAVGHIHMPQDIAPNIIGVGSLIRHSFAEVDDVKSYTLVTIDGGQVTWERRRVPCRRMVTARFTWPLDRQDQLDFESGAEVKVTVDIPEDQLATFDPTVFDGIRAGASHFVLERHTIPVERTRAPQMAKATTLGEQLATWLEVTEQRPEPRRLERLTAKTSEVQA